LVTVKLSYYWLYVVTFFCVCFIVTDVYELSGSADRAV